MLGRRCILQQTFNINMPRQNEGLALLQYFSGGCTAAR